MRYEPIDLSVLDALFQAVERTTFETWIKTEPVGKYARRAWYLYELLTGQVLDIPDVPPTENVMLLNPELHITARGLGYHLKTGHTLSVQNRPTGLAEDVIVVPCCSVRLQGLGLSCRSGV